MRFDKAVWKAEPINTADLTWRHSFVRRAVSLVLSDAEETRTGNRFVNIDVKVCMHR